MNLSNDQENLVLETQKLIHFILQKTLGITSNFKDYEDLFSIGNIGLLKASTTFDSSKNISFATFARRCITNEILMYFRKQKKYANDISINTPIPIGYDGKGNELTLRDTIRVSMPSNFVEKILDKEEITHLVSIILNCIYGKDKIAFLYLIGGVSQKKISHILDVSEHTIIRIKRRVRAKILEIVSQQFTYKEIFSVEITEDEYSISFSLKDFMESNTIVSALQNFAEKSKFVKVYCKQERIIIKVPSDPEFFSCIARAMQEIDNNR